MLTDLRYPVADPDLNRLLLGEVGPIRLYTEPLPVITFRPSTGRPVYLAFIYCRGTGLLHAHTATGTINSNVNNVIRARPGSCPVPAVHSLQSAVPKSPDRD